MDLDTLKRLFPNASRSTIAANSGSVGPVEAHRAERPTVQALVPRVQKPAGRPASVGVRIVLTQYRRRLLDGHDAVAYSCKPLTDAIAESLGVDDADPRLHWSYHQLKTDGHEGVVVLISI